MRHETARELPVRSTFSRQPPEPKNRSARGDFETVRSWCEAELKQGDTQGDWPGWLSSAYYKLGRHADSDASLERVKAIWGDAAAAGYAEIYAQRGDTLKALEWLETALRLHDTGPAGPQGRAAARSASQRAALPGSRTGAKLSAAIEISPVKDSTRAA
jgi:tetratricopeptide (TPR) repeat protein